MSEHSDSGYDGHHGADSPPDHGHHGDGNHHHHDKHHSAGHDNDVFVPIDSPSQRSPNATSPTLAGSVPPDSHRSFLQAGAFAIATAAGAHWFLKGFRARNSVDPEEKAQSRTRMAIGGVITAVGCVATLLSAKQLINQTNTAHSR